MSRFNRFAERFLNGGTALVLMGAQWLYFWALPWRHICLEDPRWGHNYVMSLAFLAVGLAYFSRRLFSYILSLFTAALIIADSFQIWPQNAIIIAGAIMVLLIIIDMILERKGDLLFKMPGSSNVAWLKKYLLCFSYLLLLSLLPIYFLIELPTGTCDPDIDAMLFNLVLLPFVILLTLEKLPIVKNKTTVKRLGFFWGMLTMVIILVFMRDEPETWPNLIFSALVTLTSFVVMLVGRRSASN